MLYYTHTIAGEDQSYFDDAVPETPAPVFAVRAFKTALFGTPHPDRDARPPAQASVKDGATERRGAPSKANTDNNTGTNFGSTRGTPGAWNLESMTSPTKGILVTPGTAATRRKTVSFGFKEAVAQEKPKIDVVDDEEPKVDPALTPYKKESGAPTTGQLRHSELTKRLIELSKQSSDQHSVLQDLGHKPSEKLHAPNPTAQIETLMIDPDTTVDLSKPRSRSGQHWKAEFEGFHKRSTREMKNVIQYSQNHKSYAMMKDAEATNLSEKLERELAKVASMERKVSKLAKHLEMAQAHGPAGDGDLAKLVNELAQQTAQAIRYKQKADRYETALQQQVSAEPLVRTDEQNTLQPGTGDNEERKGQANHPCASSHSADGNGLHTQLDSLRDFARASEEAAIRLELENTALKGTLARVKEEMMSYETRRQAREEHLKKREAKQKAARAEAEAQLAKLTLEHNDILILTQKQPQFNSGMAPNPININSCASGPNEKPIPPERVPPQDQIVARPMKDRSQARQQSKSPRKRRLQTDAVDIWTFNSPKENAGDQPPTEPTELPSSSVRQDIKRTLREISDNLISDQPPKTTLETKSPLPKLQRATQAPIASVTHRMHTRKVISSPRPSMINLTSSPAKLQPSQAIRRQDARASQGTVGRSASLMSRVGNRSTMSTARGSVLPAERAAAAKVRLAKRSAEKKRQRESTLE